MPVPLHPSSAASSPTTRPASKPLRPLPPNPRHRGLRPPGTPTRGMAALGPQDRPQPRPRSAAPPPHGLPAPAAPRTADRPRGRRLPALHPRRGQRPDKAKYAAMAAADRDLTQGLRRLLLRPRRTQRPHRRPGNSSRSSPSHVPALRCERLHRLNRRSSAADRRRHKAGTEEPATHRQWRRAGPGGVRPGAPCGPTSRPRSWAAAWSRCARRLGRRHQTENKSRRRVPGNRMQCCSATAQSPNWTGWRERSAWWRPCCTEAVHTGGPATTEWTSPPGFRRQDGGRAAQALRTARSATGRCSPCSAPALTSAPTWRCS